MIDEKDTEDKLQEVQVPCEESDQVEDRDSGETLDIQTLKQDNVNDHMDDGSKGCSTEKTETNASAKPLEISESPFKITKHETGDITNAIAEQANDGYETYTLKKILWKKQIRKRWKMSS